MAVQSNVTALMNIIQQDVQEAKIYSVSGSKDGYGIFTGSGIPYKIKDIEYWFDSSKSTVTRKNGTDEAVYNDIVEFTMSDPRNEPDSVDKDKYGIVVKIVGAKKKIINNVNQVVDKTRYSLNSTFYTRNTYKN